MTACAGCKFEMPDDWPETEIRGKAEPVKAVVCVPCSRRLGTAPTPGTYVEGRVMTK